MIRRNRILRRSDAIRSLVQETTLSPNDFIVPMFIVEGSNVKEMIASMPNYYRFSLDLAVKEAKELWQMGLKSVLLFVKVPDELKDNAGKEALNTEGLMQRAIRAIKNAVPEMCVMTDVALDPYSMYGHDGIVENFEIVNDKTVDLLAPIRPSIISLGATKSAPARACETDI